MEFKAEYKWRTNRIKGKNVIVEVLNIEELYSEIKYNDCRKWVSTSRLKPYLDPDSDGTEWLFLGYKISEQIHPNLRKFAIYKNNDISDFVDCCLDFQDAKVIIIKELLKGDENEYKANN